MRLMPVLRALCVRSAVEQTGGEALPDGWWAVIFAAEQAFKLHGVIFL